MLFISPCDPENLTREQQATGKKTNGSLLKKEKERARGGRQKVDLLLAAESVVLLAHLPFLPQTWELKPLRRPPEFPFPAKAKQAGFLQEETTSLYHRSDQPA